MHKVRRAIAAMGVALFAALPARAQLVFDFRTCDPATLEQSMTADSNKCPQNGPLAAYVGGTVTNTGSLPETGVTATLSGLASRCTAWR